MKLIDDKLGGTTPLDIIVKFPDKEKIEQEEDEFDSWDDEDKDEDDDEWRQPVLDGSK